MGLLPDHFADREHLRVGLISDTHAPDTGRAVPPQALAAFAGVDCIIHGGDIYELSILDQLEAVAPVFAARGNGDNGSSGRPRQPDDVRLRDTWVLRLAGWRVGLVHDLWEPRTSPGFRAVLTTYFATSDLDVVIHGHTHVEGAVDRDGVLCVNPGSPSLPHHTNGVGTIGFLDLGADVASASLWQITEAGIERLAGRTSVRRPGEGVMTTEVTRNDERSRYEITVDGALGGIADYVEGDDAVVIPHSEIDPSLRGRGLAAVLVRAVLDDVRRSGRSVVPECWYVAQFIDAHPEYADLRHD